MKDIIANIDTGQVNARMDVINTKLDEALDYSRDITQKMGYVTTLLD